MVREANAIQGIQGKNSVAKNENEICIGDAIQVERAERA